MPTTLQRLASRVWPLALLAMIVVVPFAVRKSYQELKAGK